MPRLDPIRHRLRVHGLAGARFTDPSSVVRWFGAMQAQEYGVAKWSIGQRARGVDEAMVDAALADGTILRTHVLRPTWHFVLAEDLRWMLALTAPRVRTAMASADRKLGIDARVISRSNAVIAAALEAGRHLTRAEIATALGAAGIEARGPRLGHLVSHAELDAVVASGAPKGKQQTYALLDERAPGTRTLEGDEALAELATRYFTSRGPATARDFRWWSSLTATDATRAIEAAAGALTEWRTDGRSWWIGSAGAPPGIRRSPGAHLLQVYDEYFVAYTESRVLVGSDPLARVLGANVVHAVVLDGRVAGHWKRAVGKRSIIIEIQLAARVRWTEREAIASAAEAHGKFASVPIELRFG